MGYKHGMTKTPTYCCWQNMKYRCYNKNSKYYNFYGGRGISVCEKWKESFLNFLKDMGEKPNKLSLDRIDNNKGYFIENCKWSNQQEVVLNI